ncbi:hypothetical protein NDU88_004631 [Pleurodeles waltl]|uniref:Uncharacterized protein n=1 Tax=Pleurodeles waltl TaxID=8319 RepID=A0AAV7QDJ5_PLEWA|nr:hypothetical protein NDU88_004631 [Pleurodeles waltl]
MTETCDDSAPGVPDTTRRAGLPIGCPECPQEGRAIGRTTEKMLGRSFRSRRPEEPTSETMRETGGEQEEAITGDVRSSWKEGSSEDPTPSWSRPLEEDRWPRGAHT